MFDPTISFSVSALVSKYSALGRVAQKALDTQVLKDSNYFVPVDEHTLEKSGVIASAGGEVKWDTPYARKQYHEYEHKSTDVNSNARWKWFEWAKSLKLAVWLAIAKKGLHA